jgi:prevent-host-death family protein
MTYMTTRTTGVLEVTVAAAKARFAACVREAEQGTTVVITKHGRRVAALVSADDVEELRRLRAAGPKAGLASLAGGWEGSDELVKEIRRHKRTPPRVIPNLD